MPPLFPGLTEADFDAYLPAKATSNAFVRPRLAVKEKMLSLGRAMAERARTANLALDVQASDERPSVWNKKSVTAQWVFLWRDAAARAELERAHAHEKKLGDSLLDPTPFYQHVFLAIHLDSECFEVALRVHGAAWADLKNLRGRLESESGRAAVGKAIAALPEGFSLGVEGGERIAAREADVARVATLVDAAAERSSWFYVARTLPRTDAVRLGADLESLAAAAFEALVPVYAVIAWRRDDDQAAIGEELVRDRAAHDAQLAEVAAREAEWQAQHDAEIARRREQAGVVTRERIAAMEPARPAAVHAATAAITAQSAAAAAAANEATSRPAARETRNVEAPRTNSAPVPRSSGPSAQREARPAGRPERPARKPDSASAERPRERGAVPGRERDSGSGGRDLRNASPDAPARPPGPDSPLRQPKQLVWMESAAPVVVGVRVRIRKGPFAGKEGMVTELDSRGQAKVSLGLLSARVEKGDLVALAETESL